ncbi:MAG: sigma 54-interacting transcriptional regulator [Thermodesulfobacteriota bacterium]
MFPLDSLKDFKEVFDAVQVGVTVFDPRGTVMVYNQAAAKMLGRDQAELVGRFIGDIFPLVWEEISEILRTGVPQLGRKLVLNGREIVVNRTPILRDGETAGVISLFQDVSAYKDALRELEAYKQLNKLLDAIIESSFDGIWVCDQEGRVIRINSASAQMDGVSADHFLGRKMEDLVKEGYIDRSVTLEVLQKKTTVSLIQKTNSGLELIVTGNPVFDENGEVQMVVVNEREINFLDRLRQELADTQALAQKYQAQLSQLQDFDDLSKKMVIRSKSMERIIEIAVKVSRVDSTVLIQGPSGVGKSMLGKMIHQLSPRKNKPLIRVDCGSIPESLIESEVFGYEQGAFTGAKAGGKPGLFELADTGTLILDEIGELPLGTQVKLLRFLEDNEISRLGGTRTRKVDVRIIAVTNRDLEQQVQQKHFRRDLYYRLNVVPLQLPALAERPEDIPVLLFHFMRHFNEKLRHNKKISPQAVDCLCRYEFPGNIRELANLIEQLIILTPHDTIQIHDLPERIRVGRREAPPAEGRDGLNLRQAVEYLEKEMIGQALARYGTQALAARHLGIDQATLSRKIRRLRLRRGELVPRA